MRGVTVRKIGGSSTSHKALNYLIGGLAVLVVALLFASKNSNGITGYVTMDPASSLGQIYGGFAPLVLILIVIVLIATYRKIIED